MERVKTPLINKPTCDGRIIIQKGGVVETNGTRKRTTHIESNSKQDGGKFLVHVSVVSFELCFFFIKKLTKEQKLVLQILENKILITISTRVFFSVLLALRLPGY